MPCRLLQVRVAALAALLVALLAGGTPVHAHPHVWVTVETTVVYDAGRIIALQHTWTFDELYTAMAIQGLDANGDGRYDRQELAELAEINIEGLKEFAYFTQARLGTRNLELATPTDYWLEHRGKILSLHFTLPLSEPVLADAPGFSFAVGDPSFFIAFDLAKDNPIRLGENAPAGCRAQIGTEARARTDAFKGAVATMPPDFNRAVLATSAKTVSIACPKF